MLNEAPNNNDVTCVANIVLNEAPNSKDTVHVANNVYLTTQHTTILNGGYIATIQKT